MHQRTDTPLSGAPLSCSPRPSTTPADALGQVLEKLRPSKFTDQSTHRMTELLVRFTIFVDKGHRR